MTDETAQPLMKRVKSYFGMTMEELKTEYKELSVEDRNDLVEEFNKMGLPTIIKKPVEVAK